MSQTAAKPGFFERLFSPPVEEPQFGSNKLETILQSKESASAAKVPGLRMTGRHQGFDKQRYYQRVEGRFTKSQASTLIDQNNIIDFHISDQEYPSRNMFAMIHIKTGRVLPNPVDKKYSREFLNAGDYAELMKVFEQSETAMVQVSFHLPPSNGEPYPSQATLDLQELKMDEFLRDWPGYEFEVFFKGRSYVLLTTTAVHVQAMNEDNRVESISKGRF